MSNNESNQQAPVFPEHFSGRQREDYELAIDLAYVANEAFDKRTEAARRVAMTGFAITEIYRRRDSATARGYDEEFVNADNEFKHLVKVANTLMPPVVTFVDSNEVVSPTPDALSA